MLMERLKRLRTVPGVGPITALTWVLEIGDVTRFRLIKQAISYCGLCGAEKNSADKVMRTPISKQRNKHIQHVLVEAAKLAPRLCHELALLHEKEMQKGNRNRATLAVARRLVCWILAVERRKQDFVPAEKLPGTAAAKNLPKNEKHQDDTVRRLPGPASRPLGEGDQTPESGIRLASQLQHSSSKLFREC
jgi:Transposase IS116/IS110/IS902 family